MGLASNLRTLKYSDLVYINRSFRVKSIYNSGLRHYLHTQRKGTSKTTCYVQLTAQHLLHHAPPSRYDKCSSQSIRTLRIATAHVVLNFTYMNLQKKPFPFSNSCKYYIYLRNVANLGGELSFVGMTEEWKILTYLIQEDKRCTISPKLIST